MKQFKTTFTALATPFLNGKVDFQSLENLVDFQLKNGVKDFVVNGTTGESPTVSFEEMREIFSLVRQKTPQGVLVFGTGSNSTIKTVEDSLKAQKMGADGVLVVVPYYNKPTQHGLFLHFKTVAESIQIPVILYNVPGRTITSMSVETTGKLSQIQNIAGMKEASGQMSLDEDMIRQSQKDFVFLSGDDGTYADFLKIGGHGVISVASHILPQAFVQITQYGHQNNHAAAKEQINKYSKLMQQLSVEANPIPVKMALHWMGIFKSPECRLPLTTLSEGLHEALKSEMKKQGLL